MQQGTVLYIADVRSLPQDWEAEEAAAAAGFDPVWTEVAAPGPGFYTPQEAQLRLAERGAGRIEAAHARYADGRLEVGARRVRLQG
ncbi:MAG: hypothetical protein SCH98_07380 [Deferrisomatales bacterium]|nr:hypothetical protein [Deferrisomatales bacterium]